MLENTAFSPRFPCWAASVAALTILAILAVCAWRQASYWQNSETLWRRAIHCTDRNHLAHYNLGVALAARGQTGMAIEHYEKALDARHITRSL